MNTIHTTDIQIANKNVVSRRSLLRSISLGAAAATGATLGLSWKEAITLQAQELQKKGMACILLWMQGGPSQFETFSPKPGHANGGETKAIKTNVAGIEISEQLPETAKVADHLCIIRSMTSKEGSHPRASYLMHTGYLPSPSVKYPSLGSIVYHELGDAAGELPGFVRIGANRFGDGGGLFGVEYDPFVVGNAKQPPANTTVYGGDDRYKRRLALLGKLEEGFAKEGGKQEVEDQKKIYAKASRLVLSPKMDVFDLEKESAKSREAYGDSNFGAGCLLARRLVSSGVPFVEVNLGNWDTHQDNFARTTTLCGEMDKPYAALIKDLAQRGMLEKTLVVWMGEFGRTPKINPNTGRDHYPRAFNVALAGGGVKGGQIIGQTDPAGADVKDRPVGVNDLLKTICHGLGIDATKENMSSIGRPIKIVDGGEVVKEVFA
jgi:hypothetical protein